MTPKYTYVFYLCIICGLLHPVQAQQTDEPEQFSGSLWFYPWSYYSPVTDQSRGGAKEVVDFVYFEGDGTAHEVSLDTRRMQGVFPYTGPTTLNLYSKGTQIIPDRPMPQPIARIQLQVQWQRTVVFLTGGSPNWTQFNGIAVDRSVARLKPGTVRLFNLSKRPLLLKFDSEQLKPFLIRPYQTHDIEVDRLDDPTVFMRAATQFEAGQDGKPNLELVISSIYRFSTTEPSLMLLMPTTEGARSYRMLNLQ